MTRICSSLACNVDTNILLASLPLFADEKVQGIEWAFDTLFKHETVPDWFVELLMAYSDAGHLIGHGVFFSLFSGRWMPDKQAWLTQLKSLSSTYRFDHVTEHFGFMTGLDFHKGAPLSIPLTASTLAIGQDRLHRIQDASGCPVGLENLAFAYSADELKRQGNFLHRLVEPVNGFIILDLHNLYCQSHNFNITGSDLMMSYPLDRVREIHISGGSWSSAGSSPDRQIRRDTHDDSVPTVVFRLLDEAIDRCPNLKYVVLEQLGTGLTADQDRDLFREDFTRMDGLVQAKNQDRSERRPDPFGLSSLPPIFSPPLEDFCLHNQQQELSFILETALDYKQAQMLLATSSLANSAWTIEQWDSDMVGTALAIAQKWRDGFE